MSEQINKASGKLYRFELTLRLTLYLTLFVNIIFITVGEAKAILLRAEATAEGIRRIADAIKGSPRGADAVALTIAEKYVEAFGQLAKQGNAIIIPASANDAGSMIAQV